MADMFEEIFKEQKILDDMIKESKSLQGLEYDYNEDQWIDRLTNAMIAEAVELKDESNWKWWKKPKELDKSNIKEELVDILHFWVSLCIRLGITPKDIHDIYMEKNKKNRKRQEDGY